jgi:hypothetical protein
MRDILLFISVAINVLIFSFVAWFGYTAYSSYKSASVSPGLSASAKIVEVIEINDGGYLARHYILDNGGSRIVVNDYSMAKPAKVVGDTVKVQAMKNTMGGNNTVQYMIMP